MRKTSNAHAIMNNPQHDVAEPRVVSSEYVYKGRLVNLRVDHIRLQGEPCELTREVVEHPGASVIVAQPDPDHLVLVRQWRHAAGARMWEIPAGTLDLGESPQTAAARELREETGYTAGRLVPLFAGYSAPGFSAELLHFFHATELIAGETDPDVGEELLVQTFSLDELEEAIFAGELPDGKTQSAVFWAVLSRRKIAV